MKIGGLQKLTLIDYPGKMVCTVFLAGCNFRCPWCYSSELVLPEKIRKQPKIPEKEFFNFLKKRKGLLDGANICGGEPTINKDLPEFIAKIKEMGYLVKLDTNGSNPQMLKELIDKKLIEYVAMDVKLPRERYQEVFGKKVKIEKIEESINILKQGKIEYEFRTTVVPTILNKEDIKKIAHWIGTKPSTCLKQTEKYYLQNFRPEKTVNPKFEKVCPYPQKYLSEIQKAVAPYFKVCEIR